MFSVRLDTARQRYVIAVGTGSTSLDFAAARDHAGHIAERLKRPDLAFSPGDYATPAGYEKYVYAVRAWRESPWRARTYFGPGTAPGAARALEACRLSGGQVRLILGEPVTGVPWLEERDVVGRIGRALGDLKVPLLFAPGASAGAPIACAHLLAVIDWDSGHGLYRHPRYREADLVLAPSGDGERPWDVVRQGRVVARFADIGKAGAWLAFMRGATIEPRVFQ